MKPDWVDCEICGVRIDRTPRAMDMNPAPPGPTMVSLSTGAPTQDLTPPKAPASALRGILALPERDEIHKLRSGDNAVGASETNDILIEGKFVSSSHAVISWSEGEGFVVTDLGSTNGTYVNDQRITRAKVADGDRVRFGNVPSILKSLV